MYELWVKNRITRKEEKLKVFNDERQFDYYLDQVDSNIYEWAMIKSNGQCIRYQEYKIKKYIRTR